MKFPSATSRQLRVCRQNDTILSNLIKYANLPTDESMYGFSNKIKARGKGRRGVVTALPLSLQVYSVIR